MSSETRLLLELDLKEDEAADKERPEDKRSKEDKGDSGFPWDLLLGRTRQQTSRSRRTRGG